MTWSSPRLLRDTRDVHNARKFLLNNFDLLTAKALLYFFFVSDECFEVEEQCQHVISEIELVLGEPLQKYF